MPSISRTWPTLFSRTSSGSVEQWTIETRDGGHRVTHGMVGGKLITTEWTKCETTNPGKKNERAPEAQAIFEAQAKWDKRYKKEPARTSLEELDAFLDSGDAAPVAMTAKTVDFEDLQFPVYAQPKLDGMRALITKDGAFSRGTERWNNINHILENLKPLFAQFPDLVLDGELYNHELAADFNTIGSILRIKDPTAEEKENSRKNIQFWWYDVQIPSKPKTPVEERLQLIQALFMQFCDARYFVPVPTLFCKDKEELDIAYDKWLEELYEGQMIRIPGTPYEFKRSKFLLKRKEFIDQEFLVHDITEGVGNRSGMAGRVICSLPNGTKFKANLKFRRPMLKELLKDAPKYRGQFATIRFFHYTPDGIPRFGRATAFRPAPSRDSL